MKLPSSRKKKGGGSGNTAVLHSRAIEQRTEVVRDRVYVHPLPQLLDNIAYLIICLPPPEVRYPLTSRGKRSSLSPNRMSNRNSSTAADLQSIPIWAILIDCGDGPSVMEQIELIRDVHYQQFTKNPFQIHAVLSTHKHHDHTAGNRFLWENFGKIQGTKTKKKRRKKNNNKSEENCAEDISIWNGMMGIVGGAIENVPWGTIKVANGEHIALPGNNPSLVEGNDCANNMNYNSFGNNMAELVEIECIAVPSHTRGSIVYALRNLTTGIGYACDASPDTDYNRGHNERFDDQNDIVSSNSGRLSPTSVQHHSDDVVAHLFSGDCMFSGGAGVAFESDIELPSDKGTDGKGFYSLFKTNSGHLSIDRCFAEILIRGLVDGACQPLLRSSFSGSDAIIEGNYGVPRENIKNRMLLFPGHEYTVDLMARQLDNTHMENLQQWEKHDPSSFFELMSHYFVMNHRRGLPRCTRLLTVPTSIRREMKINPHLRSLKRRGEHVLKAVSIWYKHGNRKGVIPAHATANANMWKGEAQYVSMPPYSNSSDTDLHTSSTLTDRTSQTTDTTWTTTQSEVNRSVFTTVYSRDMENIVVGLRAGTMNGRRAARKIGEMCRKMEEPTLLRRPIPGTLPSEKNMYLGAIALAVLGSPPSAMCKSDAMAMHLANPVDNSDYLVISKKRLVECLRRLDLLPPSAMHMPRGVDRGQSIENEFVQMIDLLWTEAKRDIADAKNKKRGGRRNRDDQQDFDLEDRNNIEDDFIELGSLKQCLYSIPYNQPSWFSKFCMPCSPSGASDPHTDPRTNKKLKRSGGELVRHDTMKCPMCWNAIGCPIHFPFESSDDNDDDHCDDDNVDAEILSDNGRGRVVKSMRSEDSNGTDVELKVVNRKFKNRKSR